MGKSTLSEAVLCAISFPFRMYFKWIRHMFPGALSVCDSHAGNNIVSHG